MFVGTLGLTVLGTVEDEIANTLVTNGVPYPSLGTIGDTCTSNYIPTGIQWTRKGTEDGSIASDIAGNDRAEERRCKGARTDTGAILIEVRPHLANGTLWHLTLWILGFGVAPTVLVIAVTRAWLGVAPTVLVIAVTCAWFNARIVTGVMCLWS